MQNTLKLSPQIQPLKVQNQSFVLQMKDMVLNSLDSSLFIDDLEYRKGQLKHIFHKGDDVIAQDTEIFSTSTAPALYLVSK